MGKIKRYGYIFIWYLGDHTPIHIHVYKSGKLVCRWKLHEDDVLTGSASRKIKKAIRELKEEGAFKRLEEQNEN